MAAVEDIASRMRHRATMWRDRRYSKAELCDAGLLDEGAEMIDRLRARLIDLVDENAALRMELQAERDL